MSQKLRIKELIAFEKKHHLWEHKLFEYPLWIHCREPLMYGEAMATRKVIKPTVKNIFQSFFKTMKFLFTQHKYKKVYFLMERAELLEIYKKDESEEKILFLNAEQEKVYEGQDYISSDFFNLLRFISRKISYLIFREKYRKVCESLIQIKADVQLEQYIKIAMGDALFLKFLSKVLSKNNKNFYTGSVIPMGEKFVNALHTYEVQHGVIHDEHIGYIGLPAVKNTLLLYSHRYEIVMRGLGYKGKLEINEYKKDFFEQKSNRHFPIVIYTQPSIGMELGINEFFKNYKPKNVFIQKHPKDYFNYEIDEKYFVTATIPSEVDYPISYTSSVLENFTLYDRDCYIYDLKYHSDVKKFLEIYTLGTTSTMIVMDSLDEIYENIIKEIKC